MSDAIALYPKCRCKWASGPHWPPLPTGEFVPTALVFSPVSDWLHDCVRDCPRHGPVKIRAAVWESA